MSKKEKDYITRTYQSKILFTENGLKILSQLGDYLGYLRNIDYKYLLDCHNNNSKPDRDSRRQLLYSYDLDKRIADSIIMCNDEQYSLAIRDHDYNIESWNKEIRNINKNLKDAKGVKKDILIKSKEKINSKILKSEKKTPSVCFGGKKLFRKIVQEPYNNSYQEDWNNKRKFLTFLGETGRKQGNSIINFDDNWNIILKLSKKLSDRLGLENNKNIIGSIDPRNGVKYFKYCLDNNVSLSYDFVWLAHKKKWRLHFTTRINKNYLSRKCHNKYITGRTCGIDQNNGFITATIIDKHGNPLYKNTFYHKSGKDIDNIVDNLVNWCIDHYCGVISIENLKNLQDRSRKSSHSSSKVRSIVNKIPKGLFKDKLVNKCEFLSINVIIVSPYNTSKNTKYWGEDCFGLTVHEKASYLIARRGIGLSLNRVSRSRTSGCVYGEDMIDNHTMITINDDNCFYNDV